MQVAHSLYGHLPVKMAIIGAVEPEPGEAYALSHEKWDCPNVGS